MSALGLHLHLNKRVLDPRGLLPMELGTLQTRSDRNTGRLHKWTSYTFLLRGMTVIPQVKEKVSSCLCKMLMGQFWIWERKTPGEPEIPYFTSESPNVSNTFWCCSWTLLGLCRLLVIEAWRKTWSFLKLIFYEKLLLDSERLSALPHFSETRRRILCFKRCASESGEEN